MAFSVQMHRFRFGEELRKEVTGKRVLITEAGKDGGLGQAFALATGLNGAAAVGVHFHRSYVDGFDLVHALCNEGVNAFPVQADVTNMGDLWATRSYVIEQGMFELLVEGSAEKARVTWKKVHLDLRQEPLNWSETHALQF